METRRSDIPIQVRHIPGTCRWTSSVPKAGAISSLIVYVEISILGKFSLSLPSLVPNPPIRRSLYPGRGSTLRSSVTKR